MPVYQFDMDDRTYEIDSGEFDLSEDELSSAASDYSGSASGVLDQLATPSKDTGTKAYVGGAEGMLPEEIDVDPEGMHGRISARHETALPRFLQTPEKAQAFSDKPGLGTGIDLLSSAAAPFEYYTAATGEGLRAAGKKIGPEGADVAPGGEGLDVDMDPGHIEADTYADTLALGGELGIALAMPVAPATQMLGRGIKAGRAAGRAPAMQGLTAALDGIKAQRMATGAAEATAAFDAGVAQKAIPQRASGAIPQPGRVGAQKALSPPRELPQFAEAAQEADAARRAGMKTRAAGQTEQIKGEFGDTQAGRVTARKGRAAHQLDVLREQVGPQAPRHMEFGEGGDIVRQDVRRMSGTNEEIIARLGTNEEGAELTQFLRKGISRGAGEDWVKAGTLDGADIKTFMRLKNRNLIETRGPKGEAEFRITEDTLKHLEGEGGVPKYLKEKAGIDQQSKAQLNEVANEFYGKPLQKLTKAEAQNLESLTPKDIAELRKGMRPISGGAERFPGADVFRRNEIIANSERFTSRTEPRFEPGFRAVRHEVVVNGKSVARTFSWDNLSGTTGISDVLSMEPGLGKGGILHAIKAAGGDIKWVASKLPYEGGTPRTIAIFEDMADLGLIHLQKNKFGEIVWVRLGDQYKALTKLRGPDPAKVGRLAGELDIRPAKGMEIDPTTGSTARQDVRGLRDADPTFQGRVHDAAAGDTTRAYNLNAQGAKAIRAKNVEELALIREVLKSDVEDVLTKSLDVATGDTPAGRASLAESIQRLLDSRTAAEGTPALGGKSLKILKQMEKDQEVAGKIAERLAKFNPKKPGYVESIARFLTDLEDTAKTSKVSFEDAVFFAWLNGRLSGPWTHIKNQVSNTARIAVRPLTRFYAGGIDMMHTALTGGERTIYAGEAIADVVGIMHGIPEAARSMMRVWSKGPSQSVFGSTTKLEFLRLAGQPKGKIGSAIGSPGRAMVAADEFYKVLSYEGSVGSQLYRASKQVGGNVDNIADDVFASIAKQASMEADLTTYTNRLSERGALGHTLSGLSKLRGRIGRYITPFFNTNTNVILEGIAHTPGLGFMTAGHQTGEVAMRGIKGSMAKQAAGTTGAVGAALMIKAMGGQITGGGPKDPSARKTLLASGWKPYSIKLPGLPPMSMTELTGIFNVLAMVGDAHDMAEDGTIDMEDAAQRISRSILHQFTYPPFADGIQDVLDLWQDGDITGSKAKRWLQRQASTVVPAGVGFLAQTQDPTIRRPSPNAPYAGVEQAVRSQVPGLQGDTPALRDIWGREVKRTLGPLETILGGTQPEITAVDNEVMRLAKIEDADGTSILAIGGTVDEIRNTELTSDEYDQYQARAGELARLSVATMIARPRWSNLSDEARARAIKDTFSRARKRAKSELVRGSKDLKTRVKDTAREARQRLRTPRAPGKALESVRRRNQ